MGVGEVKRQSRDLARMQLLNVKSNAVFFDARAE